MNGTWGKQCELGPKMISFASTHLQKPQSKKKKKEVYNNEAAHESQFIARCDSHVPRPNPSAGRRKWFPARLSFNRHSCLVKAPSN